MHAEWQIPNSLEKATSNITANPKQISDRPVPLPTTSILSALKNFSVPAYLYNLIVSYFNDRILCYNTNQGYKKYKIYLPMPLFWNTMYDGVLRLKVPKNVHIIGFADDVAVVVIAKHIDIVSVTNTTISQISDWFETNGLTLAESKTEAVFIPGRKVREVPTFCTKGVSITTQPAVYYKKRDSRRF